MSQKFRFHVDADKRVHIETVGEPATIKDLYEEWSAWLRECGETTTLPRPAHWPHPNTRGITFAFSKDDPKEVIMIHSDLGISLDIETMAAIRKTLDEIEKRWRE